MGASGAGVIAGAIGEAMPKMTKEARNIESVSTITDEGVVNAVTGDLVDRTSILG
jgi:hypothetical protein